MADTDISICNGALGRLGVSSIADFTSSDKALICGALYPKFATTLLSIYPWRFALKKSGALTQTTTPDNAYSYAYLVPSDFLTLKNAYNNSDASAIPLSNGYEIFGADILTDETALYIDYVYNIDEDNWPDWYQNFVMTALASVLAVPITEDEKKEDFYRKLAFGTPSEAGEGGLYKQCKHIDARQQPHKRMKLQSLAAARFS